MKKVLNDSYRNPLRMNLQFFADGDDNNNPDDTVNDNNNVNDDNNQNDNGDNEEITLTQEELDKKIESESDRKLSKALESQQEKMKQEMEERLQQEREEAERLAKMNQKERQDAEMQKRQEELDKREEKLKREELKASTISNYHEAGLSPDHATDVVSVVMGDYAGDTEKGVEILKKFFDEGTESKVKERLSGKTPSSGTTKTEDDPFQEKLNKYK